MFNVLVELRQERCHRAGDDADRSSDDPEVNQQLLKVFRECLRVCPRPDK